MPAIANYLGNCEVYNLIFLFLSKTNLTEIGFVIRNF